MKSSPTFNFVQNVFALNMFSNLASDRKAPAAQLQADLAVMLKTLFANTGLQQYIGTWTLEWGPVVGAYGEDIKRQVASNALFVAKNQDGQYVVATSGTNPISLYGWVVEDFDVHTMVTWPGLLDTPEAPRISSGTSTGLNHLLAMQSNGTTLMEYLSATFGAQLPYVPQQTDLVVTGHSLGGALSSVLALHIQQSIGSWNPSNTVIVNAEPSAGASPGNMAFSKYHNMMMGSRTLRFWNKLDPVPHGWQQDMVEQVPFLYYPYFKPGALLQGMVAMVLVQSREGTAPYPLGGPYTQLQQQTPPLPGQVNITLTRDPSGAAVLQFFVDYGAEKILKKLGVNSFVATMVVDAINIFLKEFASEETLDQLMDELKARIEKVAGKEPFLERLLVKLELVLRELENILVFLMQLGYQHVTSYTDLMGIAPMHPLSQSIVNNLVKKGDLDIAYTDIFDRLSDPRRTPQLLAERLGGQIDALFTPDFLQEIGWVE